MLVRDVMSSPAVTMRPTDEFDDVAPILDRLNVTSLPVVDADRHLLGAIGEADVIRQLSGRGKRTHAPKTSQVRDVMRSNVHAVDADADLTEVIAVMSGSGLKTLPVLLRGRVVGVISRRDIVRVLVSARGSRPGMMPL